MAIFRILLCDDEKTEVSRLTFLIKEVFQNKNEVGREWPAYEVISFSNPISALDFWDSGQTVDLAIFDIIMPDVTGIELAEKFREKGYKGYLVFLTSVNDFASQSYQVKAFNYLLKPVTLETLTPVLEGIFTDFNKEDNESFAIKVKTSIRHIRYGELLFATVQGHHLLLHLNEERIVKAYASLKQYAEPLLFDDRMIRANNSYIINIDYINSFGKQAVVMEDGTRISVTGSFKDFKQKCYNRMFES